MIQLQDLQHQFIRAHIQSKSGHQNPRCLWPTWDKISTESSKPCEEYENLEAHWEVVRLTFHHGEHLQNERSSSQEGSSDVGHTHGPHGSTNLWARLSILTQSVGPIPSIYFIERHFMVYAFYLFKMRCFNLNHRIV